MNKKNFKYNRHGLFVRTMPYIMQNKIKIFTCIIETIIISILAMYMPRITKQISLKKWRTIEPLDDVIKIEKPKLLCNAIKLIVDNDIQSKNQIGKDINLPDNIFFILINKSLNLL